MHFIRKYLGDYEERKLNSDLSRTLDDLLQSPGLKLEKPKTGDQGSAIVTVAVAIRL